MKNEIKGMLTVFYEEPFYVGVFEREYKGRLSVCKVTFGSEPSSAEIYDFILNNYNNLSFSKETDALNSFINKKQNPKRIKREARKTVHKKGVGTKSQEALKKQYEENKETHKKIKRNKKLEIKNEKYQLRKEKKKEKHRGR